MSILGSSGWRMLMQFGGITQLSDSLGNLCLGDEEHIGQ
jgi:hypothetical protein